MILLKDGTTYSPGLADMRAWEDAYPLIDIQQELKKMAAWCHSSPERRKTKRGIRRFVNSWLSNARPRSTSTRERSLADDLNDRSWA